MPGQIDSIPKAIAELEHRIANLEANAETGAWPVRNDNVSNPPTQGELNAIFGNIALLPNGFHAIVDDAGAGVNIWAIWAVNGVWRWEGI